MREKVGLENDEIKKEIKRFIINTFMFGINEMPFNDQDSFLENGFLDSIGILELVEFIEKKYSITCEDDELTPENLDSLQNVAEYIIKKVNSSSR